jgi:NADH:ubiquinone reductase (H+-translocating)
MQNRHVVIIGGGFAGIQAARSVRLRNKAALITLIDRSGNATMLPALPDLLSGRIRREALYRPVREVLDPSIDVVIADVRRVNLDGRSIVTDAGEFSYDGLVIATGSIPTPPPGPLADLLCHSVHTYPGALKFRQTIETRLAGAGALDILIVGAGYTGLETAVALRHGIERSGRTPTVTVVDAADQILPMVTEKERRRIQSYLEKNDIVVSTGTVVTEVSRDGEMVTVRLSDGTSLVNPVVSWAGGMAGTAAALGLEVETTRDGRIVTTGELQIPGYPEVFVAGDAVAITGGNGRVFRRAVNVSYCSGRRAGRNMAAFLEGRAPKPFHPVDLGWVIPLGAESVGRVFGVFRVGRRLGVRLHYFMSGFRHFGGGKGLPFYGRALAPEGISEPLLPGGS